MRTTSTLILTLILTYNLAIAQDTLYIYKSGSIVTKHAVANIDSVIFYKPTTSENTVTDRDGNVYNIVTIGTQTWMKENLKTTKYRNGDPIPNITSNTDWITLPIGAYSNYNNDAKNSTIYGKLYNWYAVNDSRNIAPTGWHVPTDIDWTILTNYLGGESIAGGKLKESGTTHWKSPNTGATNEKSFTALPSGYRAYDNGAFYGIEYDCSWWSSMESSTKDAWDRYLNYNYGNLNRGSNDKNDGRSIRCVKD